MKFYVLGIISCDRYGHIIKLARCTVDHSLKLCYLRADSDESGFFLQLLDCQFGIGKCIFGFQELTFGKETPLSSIGERKLCI